MRPWYEYAFCITGPLWAEYMGHWWIILTKGLLCKAFMFPLLLAWTICWINCQFARALGHYDTHNVRLYSEMTWAVGIAQLTHNEVRGGGKNPETGDRGVLAPTVDRVVSQLRNTDRPCRFAFMPHFIWVTSCISFKPDSSWKQQKNTLISEIDSVH